MTFVLAMILTCGHIARISSRLRWITALNHGGCLTRRHRLHLVLAQLITSNSAKDLEVGGLVDECSRTPTPEQELGRIEREIK
jgi:hypothetical protein